MPQELHVVRCCTCEAFQVDIVKKIPKWVCKMCGEKQSLKKVYAKGTGKECREFVQDLNEQRLSTPRELVKNAENLCKT
ncbi:MRN-interacting protein [Popillia japonica]|uniref:MRN-interacting protein n=1 Tax=Popillia japonica TaxID=7064 RepID=A0AAW1JWZ4_POPJA